MLKDLFGKNTWGYIKSGSILTSAILLAILYSVPQLCSNQRYYELYGQSHPLSLITALISLPISDIIGTNNSFLLALDAKDVILLFFLLSLSFIFNTWPRAFFCKLIERQQEILVSCNSNSVNFPKISNFNIHCDFGLCSLMFLYTSLWLLTQLFITFLVFLFFCLSNSPPLFTHVEQYAMLFLLAFSLLLTLVGEWIYHIKIFPRYVALIRTSGESLS